MKRIVIVGAAMSAMVFASGCSSVLATQDESYQGEAQYAAASASGDKALQAELERTREALASAQAELSQAESRLAQADSNELLPPNSKPGECYARLFTPASYRSREERKLVKEASEMVTVVPAQYEWVEQQVKVKDEHEHLKIVPATYRWVDEQVLVNPEHKVSRVVKPAVYETVTEKVIDKPAHFVWKKGRGPLERIDEATGEIMCRVEVPATYKTVSRKVLVSAPVVEEVTVPASYKTVQKRVVDKPEHTVSEAHPAEYKAVKVKKLVSEETVVRKQLPAEYATVSFSEKVADGKLEWKAILCETNTTTDVVAALQRALEGKGYKPGRIDGVMGSQTMAAVTAYQKDNGMASGQISVDTLRALGVM